MAWRPSIDAVLFQQMLDARRDFRLAASYELTLEAITSAKAAGYRIEPAQAAVKLDPRGPEQQIHVHRFVFTPH